MVVDLRHHAGLTCGFAGVPISSAYQPPFTFTGKLRRVCVELAPDGDNDAADAARAILQQE